jgi:putative ABC transport system ATP-binding protein
MSLAAPSHPHAGAPAALLQATDLYRVAPASGQVLLQRVSLTLRAGDRLAVVGPSGAGKSVLLRLLASLDAPDGGQLSWHGQRVTRSNILAYRRAVAYLRQRPAWLAGSVETNLRLPFTLGIYRDTQYCSDAVLALLAAAGRDARFLAKEAHDLSGGEAQIAALIRVLQLRPEVLLLDEPTAALDPHSAATLEAMVTHWFDTTPGAALAWISHDPAQALRVSNRSLLLQAGQVHEAQR